ncbi:Peroxisomal membrane protein 11A [Bienertia sinuspersici]
MAAKNQKQRDFLNHVESYLAKRDGVDKLLKISRYASKIIISSSILPHAHPLTRRLQSFESSVGLSRKAFRLGKFIQNVNALRSAAREENRSNQFIILSLLAYGGEGLYYFVEQIVWLSKSGLIDARHARELKQLSAWAEFVGYFGSIALKAEDLKELNEKLKCCVRVLRLRWQEMRIDFADGLMALADIRDGKGKIFTPLVLSCAGLLSGLISMHKNWVSC